jgi:hypothetical protein
MAEASPPVEVSLGRATGSESTINRDLVSDFEDFIAVAATRRPERSFAFIRFIFNRALKNILFYLKAKSRQSPGPLRASAMAERADDHEFDRHIKGFTPDFTATYEKADAAHKECS